MSLAQGQEGIRGHDNSCGARLLTGAHTQWGVRWIVASALLIPFFFGLVGGGPAIPVAQASPAPTGLHAAGNQILDGSGQVIRLRGVNYSGSEYACIQGWGIFDGPSDAASVQEMVTWKVNAVRVPMNEDCWLAINGAPTAYSGSNYQTAIGNYVSLLTQNGIVPILELHWSAPGTQQATGQQPMLDRDHSVEFWRQVATTFKSNTAVVFDLHNEPYPDNNSDTTAAWSCWRDGGSCSGMSFQAAGMQELVTAVRGTGATNLIMLSGIQYANTLTNWLAYKPSDPLNNLAASIHVYPTGNLCGSVSCYNTQYAPVAQQVPLIAGEFGESVDGTVCGVTKSNTLLDWLDQHNASYLAWVWNTWGTACGDLSLIINFNGTAHSPNGTNYKSRLASGTQNPPGPTSTFTPTPSPTLVSGQSPTPTATSTRTPTPTSASPQTPTRTPSPTPTQTPAATIACSPRPPIVMSHAPAGLGALQVSIFASTAPSSPNNRLHELQFGVATNAKINVQGIVGAVGNVTVALPGHPEVVSFTVHRAAPGLATTVPVVVIDDCGAWPTFVGGGPDAF